MSNPYAAGEAENDDTRPAVRQRGALYYSLGMFLIPMATTIGYSMLVTWLNKNQRVDPRYISLTIGLPWSLAAIVVAWTSSRAGFNWIAWCGLVFWFSTAALAAWVTIGFWHG